MKDNSSSSSAISIISNSNTSSNIKNNNSNNKKRSNSSSSLSPPPSIHEVVDSHAAFFCGIVAGITQAGLFNPFDRALYLSVKNRVPFLSPENFRTPYLGFLQSIGGRALSGGLYYPLEHYCLIHIVPQYNNDNDNDSNSNRVSDGPLANFMAGTIAGMVNALLLNPISAIKYKTWGRDANRGMWNETKHMFQKSGFSLRPFYNGLLPTLYRDIVFGGCYTSLRLEFHWYTASSSSSSSSSSPEYHQWCGNMLAAAAATIVSGPFNFARNVQYGTKTQTEAPPVRDVLAKLYRDIQHKPTWGEKWAHAQNRLRIGWGTMRVAVGMAFGHFVYDELMWLYEEHKFKRKQQQN